MAARDQRGAVMAGDDGLDQRARALLGLDPHRREIGGAPVPLVLHQHADAASLGAFEMALQRGDALLAQLAGAPRDDAP